MPVQNLGGAPQTNFRAKNMQNLARFRTTSKFDGEYLRNGWVRATLQDIIQSVGRIVLEMKKCSN